MKKKQHLATCLAASLLALGEQALPASRWPRHPAISFAIFATQGRNSISGTVFAEGHRPIPNIYVELLDDLNRTLSRTRTDGVGRYTFAGLAEGYYKVKVLPYGTSYEEQTQDATIINVSAAPGKGATSLQVDFHLNTARSTANNSSAAPPSAIFAQEVPEEARKFYDKGIAALREKKDEQAFEYLKRALEIFPDYYLALDRLGTEYVVRGYYRPAFVLLTKAVEVNPRSFSSNFGLGLAQYQLGQYGAAAESFRRAATLHDSSANVHLWLGKALQHLGNLDRAEAALKRANQLSGGTVAEIHWQLARIYNEQKRYREAADELELFLKYQPDSRDAEKIRQIIKQLREKHATR